MLPFFLNYLPSKLSGNWLTLNALGAFLTAFALVMAASPKMIPWLQRKQGRGQPIRDDGPKTHLAKAGTPTMGGLTILGAILATTLVFDSLANPFTLVGLLVLLVYGLTGFIDDYEKVTRQTARAMSAKMKLFLQFSAALIAALAVSFATPEPARFALAVPYFKNLALGLGWFYVPFAMVVIAGASNGVNLSDGLDGLAAGLCIIAFSTLGIVAYHADPAALPHAKELAIFCGAVAGALLGFLWFNAKPAKIFMGDTGSIALGALLGAVSVMLKSEMLLAIIGGVFVLETLSVMIQVYWFRRTGRRVFRMAPIHHHFEQLGWEETKVVARFWIAGLVFAALGLASLNIAIR